MIAQQQQTTSSRPAASRDVPPGTLWAFTSHRSMAQVIADERAQQGREIAAGGASC